MKIKFNELRLYLRHYRVKLDSTNWGTELNENMLHFYLRGKVVGVAEWLRRRIDDPLCSARTRCALHTHAVLCTHTLCSAHTRCALHAHAVLCTHTLCSARTRCALHAHAVLCTHTLCSARTRCTFYFRLFNALTLLDCLW